MSQTSTPEAHIRRGNWCAHDIYKMSCEEFDQLYQRAGGRCEICGTPGEETGHESLHIDHDRPLGMDAVRGLLCSPCNTRLGRDPHFVASAPVIRYLTNPWRGADLLEQQGEKAAEDFAQREKVMESLQQTATECERALSEAKKRRDNAIRDAHAKGLTQAQIAKTTGLTRETLRRILNPEIAKAVKEAAAERRAADRAAKQGGSD